MKTKTVYLLHFCPPFRHARHYTGSCKGKKREAVERRVAEHLAGQGSALVKAAVESGCSVVIARTWPGDRQEERRLKRRGGASRLCPLCKAAKAAGTLAEIERYERAADRVEIAPGAFLCRADYPRYKVEVDGHAVADVNRAEKIKGRVGYMWRGENFGFRLDSPDLIRARRESPDLIAAEIVRAARDAMRAAAEPDEPCDDEEPRELRAWDSSPPPPPVEYEFDLDDELPF